MAGQDCGPHQASVGPRPSKARQGKARQEAPETPTASFSSPPRLKAIGAQLSKSGLSQLPAADIASSRNRQEEEEEEEEEEERVWR